MGILKTGIVQRTDLNGSKKNYATTVMYSNIGNDELIEYMSNNANISKATALSCLYAFKGLVYTFLLNGHTLHVPQIGRFSLSLQAREADSIDKVGPNCVKKLKIRFSPTRTLAQASKSVRFHNIFIQDDTVDNG